ncbi:MAG TPA: endo-1,3-alpha-glucanase family glycosylhydrolase [Armatimonadota bacterium]|nr:endo-1,3-alpha-glucanase family glycosylhydrolase [Armatimonadota bacterium]
MAIVPLLGLWCASLFPQQPCTAEPVNITGQRPIVYAHLMHCFILGTMEKAFVNQKPMDNPDQWPEIEAGLHQIWANDVFSLKSAGAEGIKKDFAMAEAAGLDAFSLLINEKHLQPTNQFAPTIRLVAQVASTQKVKIFPDLWSTTLTAAEWEAYGKLIKELMDTYPDAFLRYHGRYLINLGNPINYGIGKGGYNEWTAMKAFFTPWGGPEKFYTILNCTWRAEDMVGYGENVDAFSMWVANQGWGDRQVQALLDFAKTYKKPLCWPVAVSYWGNRPLAQCRVAETLGVSHFSDLWRQAIALKTPFVKIESWNDFGEDHCITDTNYRGTTIMELNRYFSDWYHSGKQPAVATEKVYVFHHRQLVNATRTEATVHAHNDKWHMTPTTDYVNVVTILKKAADVQVEIAGKTWKTTVPAGYHEWLVYTPSARTEPGPEKVAFNHGADSYPSTSATRTVTIADAIPGGLPVVSIARDGKTSVVLQSRMALAATGRFDDLCLVGTGTTITAK